MIGSGCILLYCIYICMYTHVNLIKIYQSIIIYNIISIFTMQISQYACCWNIDILLLINPFETSGDHTGDDHTGICSRPTHYY